ncbi:hypothetical protein D3C72_1429680 [compost metagenome]
MACLAAKGAMESTCAVNRRHHAQGQIGGLQTRPLFNVQFQISADITWCSPRLNHRRRIQAKLAQRLRHADALGISTRQPLGWPLAGNAPAAQQGDAKSRPFFIGKANHFNRHRQTPLLLMQMRHHLQGGQYAEHAVITAGIAHRIQMRTE